MYFTSFAGEANVKESYELFSIHIIYRVTKTYSKSSSSQQLWLTFNLHCHRNVAFLSLKQIPEERMSYKESIYRSHF